MERLTNEIRRILADYKQDNLDKYLAYMNGDEEPDEEVVSMFAAHNMAAGLLEMSIEKAISAACAYIRDETTPADTCHAGSSTCPGCGTCAGPDTAFPYCN